MRLSRLARKTIEQEMTRNFMKQVDLSRKAGVSEPVISAMLHGKDIGLGTLRKVCLALSIKVDIICNLPPKAILRTGTK